MPASLVDGSDQRLLVLTPGDPESERALHGIVARHAATLTTGNVRPPAG